jgi:MinD-like ATPase involved in chromosome partitioning or flagellar assembly
MTELLAGDQPQIAAAPVAGSGPLLAVCALCGGAGASTLALLVGAWAAADAQDPVLVCDTGEPTAGLSAYAGVESLRSLGELATDLASGVPIGGGVFAEVRAGLRLIAAGPRPQEVVDRAAVVRLLGDAREEHELTVIDCGTLASTVSIAVRQLASHVAWVLPATVSGVLRARRVLELSAREAGQREMVVARFDPGGRQPPMTELTALAEARRAPLVLMPHVPDLGERRCEEGLAEAQVTLDAIASLLAR